MLAKFAYYCFVYPISRLPLYVIYVMSDLMCFFLYYVFGYRKKIIIGNLTRSFPEKSTAEIKQIARKFYHHFTDILAEGIKNLSISEKQLRKRMVVKNPELMKDLFDKELSVLLVSGHYNNWEWLITAQNFLFPHQAVGIGQPMTSKFWDKKINTKRARFGMRIIHASNVRKKLELWTAEKLAILTLSDQSPPNTHKSYWMDFLNQKTAVLFGAEMLAFQYNMAVVYFETSKVKRGYYSIELKLITENPHLCRYGEITEKHTHLLEKTIQKAPEFWMWSHKRWKRTLPDDFDALRTQQKRTFEEKMAQLN